MWLIGLAGLGDLSEAQSGAASAAPVTQHAYIPNGNAGLIATLKIMREYARDAVRDPEQKIRFLAHQLIDQSHVNPHDTLGEVRALHRFVRDEIRYTKDPDDFECVATPEATLKILHGDCDDKATLLAALLKSVGHPARFAMIGRFGEPFSHVLVETMIRQNEWLPLETILNVEPGWFPPDVTSKYTLNV